MRDPAAFLIFVTALVLPEQAEPDTDCPECWDAEAPWALRVRDALGFQRRPGPFAGIGETMAIMMGAEPRTWYDRHREKWEATGDQRELVRMARHVTLDRLPNRRYGHLVVNGRRT